MQNLYSLMSMSHVCVWVVIDTTSRLHQCRAKCRAAKLDKKAPEQHHGVETRQVNVWSICVRGSEWTRSTSRHFSSYCVTATADGDWKYQHSTKWTNRHLLPWQWLVTLTDCFVVRCDAHWRPSVYCKQYYQASAIDHQATCYSTCNRTLSRGIRVGVWKNRKTDLNLGTCGTHAPCLPYYTTDGNSFTVLLK